MFGTIRKHQTWLWVVVATITIISFIMFFNPATKSGVNTRGDGSVGTVAGRPVTLDEFNGVRNEFNIEHFFRNQTWPDRDSAVAERETWIRLLLIEKQKQLGIEVNADAATAFAARQGYFAAIPWETFQDKILKPVGLNAGDFERFLRHEAGIEQLLNITGLGGVVVTPQEAESLFRIEHEDLNTSLVSFPASNYLASVTVSNEALAKFYSDRQVNYKVPDRVQVSYVFYNVTNLLAAAKAALTNLDQDVDAHVSDINPALFPEAKTPAELKAKAKEALIHDRALTDAHRAAAAFAIDLDKVTTNKLAAFAALAAKSNLTVEVTPPFSADEAPTNLNVTSAFARTAFSLSSEEPLGGPIVARDGVYVIALKNTLPHTQPPLDEIKAKVTDDYKHEQSFELAQQAAEKFYGSLSNAMNNFGRKFTEFCAESHVKPEVLPAFSLATNNLPPELEQRINFNVVQRAAYTTRTGSATRVFEGPDGFMILYVDKRTPVDEAKVKAELPRFLTGLRQQRQLESFGRWLNEQASNDPGLRKEIEEINQKIEKQQSPGAQFGM